MFETLDHYEEFKENEELAAEHDQELLQRLKDGDI